MFKKWWVILIQGVLMIILGIFIFENPVAALAGISLWFGLLVFFTGLAGLAGWIFGEKENRETGLLVWSIVSIVFSLFILMDLLTAMKAVTIVYGLWVLVTGIHLINSGWGIKKEANIGWVLILIGVLSIVAGVMMVFNINTGVTGFATILGIQVTASGTALILLAFAKKLIVIKVKDKVHSVLKKV